MKMHYAPIGGPTLCGMSIRRAVNYTSTGYFPVTCPRCNAKLLKLALLLAKHVRQEKQDALLVDLMEARLGTL